MHFLTGSIIFFLVDRRYAANPEGMPLSCILLTMLVTFLSKTWGLRIGLNRTLRKASCLSASVSLYDGDLLTQLGTFPSSGEVLVKVGEDESIEAGLVLRRSEGILELAWGAGSINNKREKPFCIDFSSPQAQRRQRDYNKELVVKAMGKPDLVVDMTAGLGRDASLCAASGLQVVLMERNWVLFQLLKDALERLSVKNPDLASRMTVVNVDASSADLEKCSAAFNNAGSTSINVYLDPMYPPSKIGRKSAVKKDTQMLHRIVGASTGAEGDAANDKRLLERALHVATDRVVVKRPLHAASLLGRAPSGSVVGSTHRFEVYKL